MAWVAKFFDLDIDDPRLHPTAVDCGVSQTLQLDVTAAAYLMGVFRRTFPQLS